MDAATSTETSSKKRVTLRDVAREAGVSLKTASNVINETGRMSEQTRANVREVIERLGYRVNMAARNLNRDRTGFITLAVPTLTPPYLAQLANRVIDTARERGCMVYVTTYKDGSPAGVRDLLERFNATVSDGLILSMSEEMDLCPDDFDVGFPLVTVGSRTTWGRCDRVTTDDVRAAGDAASYLLDHGSGRLAVVGARHDFDETAMLAAVDGNAELRMRGVLEELRRRGMSMNPKLSDNTGYDWSIGAGYRATQRLIDTGEAFDGLVAFNDQLAIGAISALDANGIAVPGQVQVIGFDDIEEAAYLQTPLTTMASRLDWIAATAIERILGRIDGALAEPELLVATSHVVARASTRA